MTNEEMVADLKQFISATIAQQLAHVATKEDLDNGLQGLRVEMNQRFDEVDERFDEVLNAVGERFDDHDARITKLEAVKA